MHFLSSYSDKKIKIKNSGCRFTDNTSTYSVNTVLAIFFMFRYGNRPFEQTQNKRRRRKKRIVIWFLIE